MEQIKTGRTCSECKRELVQNGTNYGMYCIGTDCSLQYQTQIKPVSKWVPEDEKDYFKKDMDAIMSNVEEAQGVRIFGTATRNPLGNKIQYFGPDGLLSIPALRAYGRYMRKHRKQADGTLRDFNNWRQGDGIPQKVCIDSMGRHLLDLAELLEGVDVIDESTGEAVTVQDACSAILFNAFAILDAEVRGLNQ